MTEKLLEAKESGDFKGDDGLTPFIGENGNWWIGTEDTGTKARGKDGAPGRDGVDGRDGIDGKDGAVGPQGPQGPSGKDGYTPVKDVDYFDGLPGQNGKDGTPGKDGVNGKDGKDGTSVTVLSVKESNTDGGSNIVTFSDGKTLTIKNGSKGTDGKNGTNGTDGKDGKDGVDGKDYILTEADKTEIANLVLANFTDVSEVGQ